MAPTPGNVDFFTNPKASFGDFAKKYGAPKFHGASQVNGAPKVNGTTKVNTGPAQVSKVPATTTKAIPEDATPPAAQSNDFDDLQSKPNSASLTAHPSGEDSIIPYISKPTQFFSPAVNQQTSTTASPKHTVSSGTEKMNMISRVHAFEHAIVNSVTQQTKQLVSQIEACQIEETQQANAASVTSIGEAGSPTSVYSLAVQKHAGRSGSVDKHNDALTANGNDNNTTLMPLYIRTLPPYKSATLSTTPLPPTTTTPPILFPHSFLITHLGGTEFSPGFYYPATALTALLTEAPAQRAQRLKNPKKALPRPEKRSYYLLDPSTNPYVPRVAGEHGASLCLFFRDWDGETPEGVYEDVPVFVALPEFNTHLGTAGGEATRNGNSNVAAQPFTRGASSHPTSNSAAQGQSQAQNQNQNQANVTPPTPEKEKLYTYMGQYTQTRWSDRLSHTETSLLPPAPKTHWAHLLTSPLRPLWLAQKLLHAIEPPPVYTGRVPAIGERVTEELKDDIDRFFGECRDWREDVEGEVKDLGVEGVMEWFGEADAGVRPGGRFWWEYLCCMGWDRGFVYGLVGELKRAEAAEVEGRNGPAKRAGAKLVDGSEKGLKAAGFGTGTGNGTGNPS